MGIGIGVSGLYPPFKYLWTWQVEHEQSIMIEECMQQYHLVNKIGCNGVEELVHKVME